MRPTSALAVADQHRSASGRRPCARAGTSPRRGVVGVVLQRGGLGASAALTRRRACRSAARRSRRRRGRRRSAEDRDAGDGLVAVGRPRSADQDDRRIASLRVAVALPDGWLSVPARLKPLAGSDALVARAAHHLRAARRPTRSRRATTSSDCAGTSNRTQASGLVGPERRVERRAGILKRQRVGRDVDDAAARFRCAG